MRKAFVQTLVRLAEGDPRIVLLTGDLGYLALEPFEEKFPKRFFNVGVAEQNMIGLATGLAEAGFVAFVYSIVPFAVLRPCEFIRNGPVLHRLPVRIVGIGGGFDYGPNGFTHYGLEDLATLRALPGISIFAPADSLQATSVVQQTWNLPGPVYYRLGKDDGLVVDGLDGRFAPGRLQIVRDGGQIALVSTGGISAEAAQAAGLLAKAGHNPTFAVLASVQPAPIGDLLGLLERHQVVLTVEAHSIHGGIGSLIAEVIAENGLSCRLVRCGVRAGGDGRTGSQPWLHEQHGLSASRIANTAFAALQAS